MSTIIDISWPISPAMTSYKNNKPVVFTTTRTIEDSGTQLPHTHMHETNVLCNTHTGTHVDAPSHKLLGAKNIDQISLIALIGPAVVLDLTQVQGGITEQDLASHQVLAGDIVLLKTTNSHLSSTAPFHAEFVYLAPSGAAWLAQKEIKAVGIDYLGIERKSPTHETHTLLLQKEIPIIEGLRLGHVEAGRYTCICLPLPLLGVEAAPARAILLDVDDQEILQRT